MPRPASSGPTAGPIWLVRHAPTEWTGTRWCGRSDPALTQAGGEAAERVAGEIAADLAAQLSRGHTTDPAILASPLRRALQTAGAIGREVGSRVRIEPDLVEVDFGMVDGLTWDELVAAYPNLSNAILAGTDADWPGGEAAAEVARRAESVSERIIGIAATGPVIAVSHGRLLREIARRIVPGNPAPEAPFEPASARRLDLIDGRWIPATIEAVSVA